MLDRVQGGFGSIVDRKRIAAAGHGLGATTTYVLSLLSEGADPRIRASSPSGARSPATPTSTSRGVNTPLLAIHGEADEVDPIDDAHEVFALAKPPKFFVTLLGADGTSPFATANDPAVQVVEETTLDFFTAYLRGRVERARTNSRATARRPRSPGSGSCCPSPFTPVPTRKQHRVREFRNRLGGDRRRHPRRDRRRPGRPARAVARARGPRGASGGRALGRGHRARAHTSRCSSSTAPSTWSACSPARSCARCRRT